MGKNNDNDSNKSAADDALDEPTKWGDDAFDAVGNFFNNTYPTKKEDDDD